VNREWALPVILGLLAAAALWMVPHGPKGDPGGPTATTSSSGTTTASAEPAILLPFGSGQAVDQGSLSFLVLAPHGKAAALRAFNESSFPSSADELQWQGDRLALYPVTQVNACPAPPPGTAVSCDPPWAFGQWLLPKAGGVPASTRPLLGVDGYNGTRITVHVFDETGLLAATNADANETARLSGKAHPQQLPGGVWYVGANSTAPNGTQPVPATARALFQQLDPLMRGLPIGGVASVRSDAYAALYGTLYVTVRIDGLVWAP
jgi:hypothetical protein